jgi:hypothetical protein
MQGKSLLSNGSDKGMQSGGNNLHSNSIIIYVFSLANV